MALDDFFKALLEDGRVRVPPPQALTAQELSALDERLREFESIYRLELPGRPPPLAPAAARWAAERFFRACQLAVYRDLPAEAVEQEMTLVFAETKDAAAHYSVDLVFRFLPDLLRFAKGAAERDPLVEHLRNCCREWPLSSVGVSDLGVLSVDGFFGDACLRRLYVDRILERRDKSRLEDERVREAVQAALGEQTALAAEFASALE